MFVSLNHADTISIHSAARAETYAFATCSTSTTDFNPLRREGGDGRRRLFHFPDIHFNPLRREGGDNML